MMSFSRIKGVYLRYFYVFIKGPQQLSDLFYWPFIDILLWGLTSVWISSQHPSENLPLMMMTGLILWQVVWRGAVDISVSLLQELWHRNLINLFSTPLKLSEWALGAILVSLTKWFVTISFGLSLVHLLYGLNPLSIGFYFFPSALILIFFGWTLGFIAGSIIIYFGHSLEAFAWMIGSMLAPFSAVFYPLNILPVWAQKISAVLPTTYIFEGMRSLIEGNELPTNYLLLPAVLGALYFVAAMLLFRYSFHRSREKGLARLE